MEPEKKNAKASNIYQTKGKVNVRSDLGNFVTKAETKGSRPFIPMDTGGYRRVMVILRTKVR